MSEVFEVFMARPHSIQPASRTENGLGSNAELGDEGDAMAKSNSVVKVRLDNDGVKSEVVDVLAHGIV